MLLFTVLKFRLELLKLLRQLLLLQLLLALLQILFTDFLKLVQLRQQVTLRLHFLVGIDLDQIKFFFGLNFTVQTMLLLVPA